MKMILQQHIAMHSDLVLPGREVYRIQQLFVSSVAEQMDWPCAPRCKTWCKCPAIAKRGSRAMGRDGSGSQPQPAYKLVTGNWYWGVPMRSMPHDKLSNQSNNWAMAAPCNGAPCCGTIIEISSPRTMRTHSLRILLLTM